MARLARWDRATADRPNRYLAISQYVARRIGLYYNRQSAIVYPPVDTEAFTPGDPGSRQRPRRSCRPWCPTNAWSWPSQPLTPPSCRSTSSATVLNAPAWRRWRPTRARRAAARPPRRRRGPRPLPHRPRRAAARRRGLRTGAGGGAGLWPAGGRARPRRRDRDGDRRGDRPARARRLGGLVGGGAPPRRHPPGTPPASAPTPSASATARFRAEFQAAVDEVLGGAG